MNRRCPVCNAGAGQALLTLHYTLFDDSRLPRHTAITRCDACGMVYADSQACEADYLAHYQQLSVYAAAHLRAGSGESAGDAERLSRVCDHISPWLGPDRRLADIGAGAGGLLGRVRDRFGCQVIGVDPDPDCVARLKALGYEALAGTLDADLSSTLQGGADVVTLCHVLEHVWSAHDALRSAFSILRPGGVVYVETPDRQRYADYANVPHYYFDPEHINHFGAADFARLAAECHGYCVAAGQSTIAMPGASAYPVCWAVLSPGEGVSIDMNFCKGSGIETYIAQQASIWPAWTASARAALQAAAGPWIVWGCGSQAQRALSQDWIEPDAILVFVDSDKGKQGRHFGGKPVMAPAEALARWPQQPVLLLAADSARAAIRAEILRNWPERLVLEVGGSSAVECAS